MTAAAIATIGHNSANVLEMIDEEPELIYRNPEIVEQMYAALEAAIKEQPVDLTTAKGRSAITALSGSISTRRATAEKTGKALTEFHRKETKKVNDVKSAVMDRLAELRDLARKPLTEWEALEYARKDTINRARVLFADAAAMRGDMADALGYLERVKSAELDPEVFADLLETAQAEQAAAITALEKIIADLKQAEADRAELERLRAEKAEAERAAAEKKAKEDGERAERERIDAAAKAAAERATEEERQSAQAAIDAANKAAADAQAELDRQAAEKARIEKEQAARDADLAHRSNVMRKAKEAMMTLGLSEDQARDVVRAIVAGNVPNVTLRF